MKHLKRNWLPVFQCIFCPEKGSSPLVSHKPLKNYGIIGGILHFFLQNTQPQDSDTASTSFNWFHRIFPSPILLGSRSQMTGTPLNQRSYRPSSQMFNADSLLHDASCFYVVLQYVSTRFGGNDDRWWAKSSVTQHLMPSRLQSCSIAPFGNASKRHVVVH